MTKDTTGKTVHNHVIAQAEELVMQQRNVFAMTDIRGTNVNTVSAFNW